jgi:replicative DNA helicase
MKMEYHWYPHHLDQRGLAEAVVLSLLIGDRADPDAGFYLQRLTPQHFAVAAHNVIYRHILLVREDGRPINAEEIEYSIEKAGERFPGGDIYLGELAKGWQILFYGDLCYWASLLWNSDTGARHE